MTTCSKIGKIRCVNPALLLGLQPAANMSALSDNYNDELIAAVCGVTEEQHTVPGPGF